MCGDETNHNHSKRLVNAEVNINVARLDVPLRPFKARLNQSFTAIFKGVPTDCENVTCRIFRIGENRGFYEIALSVGPDGALGKFPGTCFNELGLSKYEVHAKDADGNSTALGVGQIHIQPFSAGGAPLEVGEEHPVSIIKDANGGDHTITATHDGLSETSVVDDDWAVGRGSAEMPTVTDKNGHLHSITATDGGDGEPTSVIGENENA